MLPRVLDLGVFQLTMLVTTNLASRLGHGSVSALEWGWGAMQLPETVIGTAFGLVAFPTLAELAARRDLAGLRGTLAETLRLVLVLSVPATCGLILLGQPFLQVLYQRGAFDASATEAVYSRLALLRHRPCRPVDSGAGRARLFRSARHGHTPVRRDRLGCGQRSPGPLAHCPLELWWPRPEQFAGRFCRGPRAPVHSQPPSRRCRGPADAVDTGPRGRGLGLHERCHRRRHMLGVNRAAPAPSSWWSWGVGWVFWCT